MPEAQKKPGLAHAAEQIRMKAGRLERQLIEINQTIRFDPRTPGLADRTRALEREAGDLSTDLATLADRLQAEGE